MNDYFIRVTQDDYPRLIALGKMLGAITEQDGVIVATQCGAWDYIGPICDAQEVPLRSPEGEEYVHINLRTPLALRAVALTLAKASPEIAAGLSQLDQFFLVDADGLARAPAVPHRVFA